MKAKYWYIKERCNSQLSRPYYNALGNISKKEATKHENPIYGHNYLLRFNNESDYEKEISKLKEQGYKFY